MPKIFISYRRRDSAHVSGRIYDILVEQFGRENVLKDIDNIRAGIDFREEVERLLGLCEVALAVVGPQWIGTDDASGTRRLDEADDPVRVEIEFLIKRGIPIIPILFDGMTMEQLKDVPESIATFVYRNGFEIRPDPYFRPDMDLVVRRIKTDFPTATERETQAVQERLAELERERKLADDRRRVADLEAEAQQKKEQERVALEVAEEERRRQEEAESRAKAEANFKEKQAILSKQRDRIAGAFAFLIAALGAALGVLLGHGIWSGALRAFGGTAGAVVIIGVFVLVVGFAGLVSGTVLGSGITGTAASAIISISGTVAGVTFFLIRGVNVGGGHTGTLVGGGLGLLGGAFIFGIVGWIMRNEYASPWYVKGDARLFIPVAERVRPPAPTKAPPASAAASVPTTDAAVAMVSAQSAAPIIAGAPVATASAPLAMGGVSRNQPAAAPGYALCPYCEKPVKSPVAGLNTRCPSCQRFVFNCRKCGTLLSTYLQQQRVEIEDPEYVHKMGSAETGRYFQRQAIGDPAGNSSMGIQDPDRYMEVERWNPCPTCGEPDPTGLVKKEGDPYGLYKAKGGAVVTKIFPPRLTQAQQALQPPQGPVPVLRTDGLYMAPRDHGYDCLRFYHDDRIAYVSVRTKAPPEKAAQEVAKWLRYKGTDKGTLSGKRERIYPDHSKRADDKLYATFNYKVWVNSVASNYPGSKTFTGVVESSDFIQLDYSIYETGRKGRSMFTFVPATFKHR